MEPLLGRMTRAMRLEPSLYEEVEADKGATSQALTVVLISSVCAGIGTAGSLGLPGLFGGLLVSLIGWVVWAGLTYVIGTKLLPGPNTKANLGELLRTTGFASAPGVFRVLAAIPLVGMVVSLLVSIWMLVAFVIAVRQALDYENTGRAVLVCIIGWFIYMGFVVALALVLGVGGAAVVNSTGG
ncbi:MAG: hypothetical protein DHS20C21_20370 [Gemmatimonadota bacterium]|nr:MAG: hypothetical protein DHS20C21_20370 [Gemmatimonadota bacterium]